jgi:stage II sporulation protein D
VETTVGIESPQQTWMRVLLFDKLNECTIASMSGFTVVDPASGSRGEFRADEPVNVTVEDGQLSFGQHRFGTSAEIRTHDPFVFELNGVSYRGYLNLRVVDTGAGIEVVNALPMEAYLLGVIGVEMYSYWEPEALKAQSVVSRTYSLYIKNRFGARRTWDVTATEANQVYRGIKAETPTIRQAVTDTAGEVLIGTYPDGRQLLFPTYFSSSCGGHTEQASQVFGDTTEIIAAVECPYCEKTARKKDFHWSPVQMKMDQISTKLLSRYASLEKLEQIVDFEIIQTGHFGRITRVRLLGRNGNTDTLRGEDFRLSVDPTGRLLKSTFFSIRKKGADVFFENGRGFGHGVGLCQHGTQEIARQGNDYRQILDFYFPSAKLVSIETTIDP